MWQVLLAAAAAAGSGIIAKKFINPTENEKPVSDFKQNHQECEQTKSSQPKDSTSPLDQERSSQEKRDATSDDGKIFRFSTPQPESELKKKTGIRSRGFKKNGGAKKGKKSGPVEGDDQRANGSGKKISVCLKKRRTGKHVPGKCESCASKDNSFGWGVGIGIMYMMSAGKAEISRLNGAMDETTKMIQELKDEISRRKSSCNMDTFVAGNEAQTNKKHIERSYSARLFNKPKTFCPSLIEEGECGNSVLSGEERPEVLEMDQLEAELESELQKLPWCGTESSGSEGRQDLFEAEISTKEHQSEGHDNSSLYEYNGVLPAELDKKLCHLLIDRQESQIVELEAELNQAHSKLQEKEAQLQALKNCVKRLSEFSLASPSDEETEENEEVRTRDGIEGNLGFELTRSTVGMKRAMGYESHMCSLE